MYSRGPKSPEDVIALLDYSGDGYAKSTVPKDILQMFEGLCKTRIERWLSGVGHVDVPRVRAILTDDHFYEERNNSLLRATAFLNAITGEKTLPPGDLRIHVSLRYTV